MNHQNPWIDPRVGDVRSAAALAYLIGRGWTPLAESQANFQELEPPLGDNNAPIVRVPLREQGRDYTQRVIELVADIARAEKRPAVAVLEDILARSGTSTNGEPAAQPAQGPSTIP